MKASEILTEEHELIVRMLDCLDALTRRFQAMGRIEAGLARQIIDFFRNFADRCHHGKEEVHFFPLMEVRGFPREGGPTGVMLMEHEQGRDAVRGMAVAVDSGSVADFVRHAAVYSSLLRQHIEKENHCLYTMADSAFSAQDQEGLTGRFAESAAKELAGLRDKYAAMVGEVEDQVKNPPRPAPETGEKEK